MSQACYLSPVFGAGAQLFTNQGVVLAGGIISAFQAGTTTPQLMYTDSTGTTPIGTTLTLDASGRPAQEIWLTAGQPYKFTVTTATGVSVGYTYDNISGINDPGSSSAVSAEWTASGLTPTFISSSSFSLTGNQTAKFPVGQRIKYVVSGGTGYATVISSTYGSVTTITVQTDSIVLDSGLSAVSYSFLNAAAPSVDAIGVKYDSAITPPTTPTSVASLLGRVNYATTLITTGGSGSAFTVTLSPAPSAYAVNQPMLIQFSFTPSGSPTMNVNGLGAKSLNQVNGAGTQVPASVVAGQIAQVVYDGTNLVVISPAASGCLLRTTYFTSSGTWTIGAGTNKIVVQGVGGGGGANASGNGNGGGGAGGYFKKTITSPAGSYSVTIGAGGSNTGGNGGTTSFGAVCSAGGGNGATQATGGGYGGAGGTATGGDLNLQGGGGTWGGIFFTSPNQNAFGSGGSSFFGGGANGVTNASSGTAGGTNTGGGGSGGLSLGGAGAAGLVIVEEYS